MMAFEIFQKYRKMDYAVIAFSSLIWLILATFSNTFEPQLAYLLSLLFGLILLSFAVQITRKAGTGLLFMGVSSILTSHIGDIGVVGFQKFIMFILAGIVFEAVFLILKLEVKDIQLDILGGTAIAGMMIPLFMGLIISSALAWQLINGLLNMMITSFFIGVIGYVVSFMFWHAFRRRKFMVKLMFGL